MLDDETVRWALIIMVFIALIAGTFLLTQDPVSGNAVLSLRPKAARFSASSCGTLDTALEESCKEECAVLRACDAYRASCGAAEPFSCVCIRCEKN